MPQNLKKLAWVLGVSALLELGSSISNPLASVAQETGPRPPSCIPNPSGAGSKCNYEGGDNYIGSFSNGVPNGRGVYVYANGDRYEGEWRNGRPNGRGVFIFANDARYEGVFQDGVIVQGRSIFSDGIYEGPFRIVRFVNTDIISSQPSGRGRFTFPNGDRYEGEFFAGAIFGRGTLVRTDGSRCEAQFYNSKLDGKGSCRYRNGDRYEGELREGRPHGNGLLIQANGRRYSGLFRDGQPFDPKAKQ